MTSIERGCDMMVPTEAGDPAAMRRCGAEPTVVRHHPSGDEFCGDHQSWAKDAAMANGTIEILTPPGLESETVLECGDSPDALAPYEDGEPAKRFVRMTMTVRPTTQEMMDVLIAAGGCCLSGTCGACDRCKETG